MSGTISYQIPVAGQPNSTEDAKVATALTTLLSAINGGLDSTNIAAVLAQAAGVNQAGQTVKAAVNIAASESRTNVAYGTLTTPDQVAGIVLPSNGLIAVWYQALWQESVANRARAAIFVGANQLKIHRPIQGSPTTQAAMTSAISANTNCGLSTASFGLYSDGNGANSGDVTTGQVVGMYTDGGTNSNIELGGGQQPLDVTAAGTGMAPSGPCYIFAAAGTYTVSVQYKSSSGSVTASNRKLWVQALSFA